MLPVLGRRDPTTPWHVVETHAIELGYAFQLTNFIRDVGEDLDRGRIYLPQADLARFGIGSLEDRVATPAVRELIAFEVSRARRHYAAARPGIEMLDAGSQPCIRTAYRLYSGILDEIERADFDVFSRRAVVPRRRQVAVAASCLLLAVSLVFAGIYVMRVTKEA